MAIGGSCSKVQRHHITGSQSLFSRGGSTGRSISTSGAHHFDICEDFECSSRNGTLRCLDIRQAYEQKNNNNAVEEVLLESDLVTKQSYNNQLTGLILRWVMNVCLIGTGAGRLEMGPMR